MNPLTASPYTNIPTRPIVLACVDQSPYATFVTDYAAWAAMRLNTGLELLHVIDRNPELGPDQDHSGAIGFNEQENLLKRIVDEDEQRSRLARETGRVFLHTLKTRALQMAAEQPIERSPQSSPSSPSSPFSQPQQPLSVDTRQRHGSLVDSLLERQDQTTLVVMGRRGASSEATDLNNASNPTSYKTPRIHPLGSNLESVVRSMKCPILSVTDEFKAPSHLMLAYDDGSASRKGLDMVASSPAFAGIKCSVVMVKDKASRASARQLEQAKHKLTEAGLDVETHLLIGDLESLVAQQIQTLGIDILVMGAYTHSPWRSLFMGSHTTDLLRAARVPTLLLR
jgi:nucleotide-binding universal stress UspA family protein